MTRNPYRTALGALAAASAGLGALIWLFSSLALGGTFAGDHATLAWQSLGVWLLVAGAVLLVVWLVVSAALYRPATSDPSLVTAETPASSRIEG